MAIVKRVVPLVVALALAAPAAARASVQFSAPAPLPGSLPSSDPNNPQRQGGEPSAIFDPRGQILYAGSPGGPNRGGNFWRSTDAGRTFSPGISVGSIAGGGDSDIAVGYDAAHTVFYIDLEDLVASDVCRSTDEGQSFPGDGCSSGFATNQQQPLVDRPWINAVPGHPGLLYGTYDGLAFGGGAPEVQQSTDGGTTFIQCGQVLEPGSSALAHFSPTGATENSETIGRPAVGADGSIYVPFTEPHIVGQQASEPNDPAGGNLYIGIGRGGCPSPASSFHDVAVYENDQGRGSEFSAIFPYVAVDGAGNLYMLGDGRLTGNESGQGVYLFVSTDKGLHWSAPIKVNNGPPQGAQLASLAGGKGAGEAIIGWYSSSSTDSNSPSAQWRYQVAETFDLGRNFTQTTLTPDPIHYGAICDLGVECTGGRNLLDFSTVTVNPVSGCAFALFAGDPYDTPQNGRTDSAAAYYANQTGTPCLTQAASKVPPGAPGSGRPPRRMSLSVRPRIVVAGSCHTFTFRTTTGSGRRARAVRSALVRFAGHRARSGRRGYAHIRACLRRVSSYPAHATAAGDARATTRVAVRRSSARFSG